MNRTRAIICTAMMYLYGKIHNKKKICTPVRHIMLIMMMYVGLCDAIKTFNDLVARAHIEKGEARHKHIP